MSDYDAIVIGSGHNALVCALYLVRAGWRVLVLERNSHIGGASRTVELTLPGFKHDVAVTNINQFVASAAYRDFGEQLRAAGLKVLSNRLPYATAFETGGAIRIFADSELTHHEIARAGPNDLAKWREAASLFDRSAPHIFPLFHEEAPSAAMLRRGAHFFLKRPVDALRVANIARKTLRHFVDGQFQSAEVKAIFAPWAFHLDCGPDVAGGAMFAFLAAMAGYRYGAHVAEGGTGCISDVLRGLIEQFGGQVRANSEVVRVRVTNKRATAVETFNGEVITASRAIVAGVTPRLLFGRLVARNELPTGFVRRIERFRYAPGTFVIHLALSEKLIWTAGEDLSDFTYLHLSATVDEIARTYTAALEGRLPVRPMLVVSQTTSVDPSRAPPGRHVVRIHVRMVPSTVHGDAACVIEQQEWSKIKEAYADRVIDILCECAPNVKAALLARHVVSPDDLETENPNFVGGDCGSGSHHPDQNYMFRPLAGWSRYATPIDRLYMIGASTWPGSGMNAASGYLTAQKLLRTN